MTQGDGLSQLLFGKSNLEKLVWSDDWWEKNTSITENEAVEGTKKSKPIRPIAHWAHTWIIINIHWIDNHFIIFINETFLLIEGEKI